MRNGSVLTCEEETIDDAGVSTYWRTFKFPFRNGQGEVFLGGMSVNITENDSDGRRWRALIRNSDY